MTDREETLHSYSYYAEVNMMYNDEEEEDEDDWFGWGLELELEPVPPVASLHQR